MNNNPLWYLTGILATISVILTFIEAYQDYAGNRKARDVLAEINWWGLWLTFTVLIGACIWEIAAA